MAIKINGTAVVNDSRELENITNLKTVGGQSILGAGDIVVGDVTSSDTQVLTNKTLSGAVYSNEVNVTGSVRSSAVAVSALAVDCSLGNFFTKTITSNSSFTFTNVPSAGNVYSFVLEISHTGGTITWPASVRWPADTAPTLTAGKTHLFVFVTDDGGTAWRGASSVDYTN